MWDEAAAGNGAFVRPLTAWLRKPTKWDPFGRMGQGGRTNEKTGPWSGCMVLLRGEVITSHWLS